MDAKQAESVLINATQSRIVELRREANELESALRVILTPQAPQSGLPAPSGNPAQIPSGAVLVKAGPAAKVAEHANGAGSAPAGARRA